MRAWPSGGGPEPPDCRSGYSVATWARASPITPRPSAEVIVPVHRRSSSLPCRALNPDVGVVHAQQADRDGNVMLWGISGVQKECVLASRRAIATVEEIVDSFQPRVNGIVIPAWVLDAVCLVPGGAHPSYADGYSERDNDFYAGWDEVSRDRSAFGQWLKQLMVEAP